MARNTKLKRIGKRVAIVEQLFADLPKSVRTEQVLVAIASAAGIPEDATRERFRVALAMMGSSS